MVESAAHTHTRDITALLLVGGQFIDRLWVGVP